MASKFIDEIMREPRKLFLRLKTNIKRPEACRGGVANTKCECAATEIVFRLTILLQFFVSNYVCRMKKP